MSNCLTSTSRTIELRSPSDCLRAIQNKMQEYIDNGARLGWLLDPLGQQVEIYRQGQEKEVLSYPQRDRADAQTQTAISLLNLCQLLKMPLVQVWLALLLNGFAVEQRGEFYDIEQVWILSHLPSITLR